MGPTRRRDLVFAAAAAAIVGYLLVVWLYRWFPPITLWTGVSLLVVAGAEAGWGYVVRGRVRDGRIGVGGGRLHPLAVARSVVTAKASAWLGALVSGWWLGVLGYLLPRRGIRIPHEDIPGSVVAALCALALVAAALWLEHCCKSPDEPEQPRDAALE